MLRVGVYGGAFSPIHNGHIATAKAFMEKMWLDVLFVVPTGEGPWKDISKGYVSARDRLRMCELAFEGVEGVIVSDIEIRRQGPSYTVDTLRQLKDDDRRLFLLCGTDVIMKIGNWADADELFSLCYPTYIRRESDEELDEKIIERIAEYKQKYGKNVVKIVAPVVELSSSEVRKMIASGNDISGVVPPAVADYIKERGLYLDI
ncbi:MAG: nicotinate (nicotinamide) nucleotide adenylyltransferase [Clostridia bacterium]|nr:nicotinate (nicotinamide) nucleotide adenylyltransferase [Clostridia bacterium]